MVSRISLIRHVSVWRRIYDIFEKENFVLTFDDDNINFTQAQNVYVTFKSKGKTLTKSGDSLTITEKTISVYLTQVETLSFDEGVIQIQANWTFPDGSRAASAVVNYNVGKQLLEVVIT